jgi:hypothetical protein
MNPLSERARLMLERYKGLETMSGSEKTRLLEDIQNANARGVLPRFEVSAAPSMASQGSSFGRGWSAPARRLIIVSTLLALPAVAAVTIAVRQTRSRDQHPSDQHPSVEAHVASTRVAPTIAPATVEVAPSQKDDRGSVETTRRVAPTSPKRVVAPKTARGPAVESTIDEEMHVLKEAQAADDAGDWRRALQLLDEYPRRFPSGRLADARAVEHLVVLCKLGRVTAARQEAVRFLSRYPNSPFTDRVKGICVSKDGP